MKIENAAMLAGAVMFVCFIAAVLGEEWIDNKTHVTENAAMHETLRICYEQQRDSCEKLEAELLNSN